MRSGIMEKKFQLRHIFSCYRQELLTFLAFALLGMGIGLYLGKNMTLFYQYRLKAKMSQDDAACLQQLAQIMVLPEENPVMSQIVDVSTLKDKPFFAQAQNGDKIVLYQQAQKAILYRPATRQVVEVMPLTMDSSGVGF